MSRRPRKRLQRILIATLALCALFAATLLALLCNASVETTVSGAPTRLRLHLPGGRDIAFPLYTAATGTVHLAGFLAGPIIRNHGDHGWSADWFCIDRASHLETRTMPIRIECNGRQMDYAPRPAQIPAAVAPMPERIAVLSDIEGNIRFLDRALFQLGVTDRSGHWAFHNQHLVILGDSVDRGRDVSAVLWRLYTLSQQADIAGGAVHVLLGNHEQYLLRTNPSRSNADARFALNAIGGYATAHAADTVIGQWLRQQPVVLQLGDVLFAHGGISPQVAGAGLGVEDLNTAMRNYWRTPAEQVRHSPALDAVLGLQGVTQYRGYFRAMEGRYPRATEADVARVLDQFAARLIVVGHTLVPQISLLHGGRVYAIDVNSNEAAAQALVFAHGSPRIVDIGTPRALAVSAHRPSRDFNLLDAADRRLLFDAIGDLQRLSALPHPY
ncbi:MAG TPA: metallophosphoesterase [Rhodanobacteraceae bacterium]|nr:metallophosphoesterase [Rhodanobacteraceae bacterium]